VCEPYVPSRTTSGPESTGRSGRGGAYGRQFGSGGDQHRRSDRVEVGLPRPRGAGCRRNRSQQLDRPVDVPAFVDGAVDGAVGTALCLTEPMTAAA
jgi:hypothetical protein